MPPTKLTLYRGPVGPVYLETHRQLLYEWQRVHDWGTQLWGPRMRVYPNHRQHIQEAAAGLKQVIDVLQEFKLPENPELLDRQIEWNVRTVNNRHTPRHLWRENTLDAWYQILGVLTEFHEEYLILEDSPEEPKYRQTIDGLTTAIECLAPVKFPDTFDKLL
jgi:hypothetical protein